MTWHNLLPFDIINAEEISTEASLYETFYRKHGMRFVSKLTSPALFPISEWDVVKEAVLHYLPSGPADYGISDTDVLLNGWNKFIWVKHVLDLSQELGNPKTKFFNAKLAIRAYRKIYPRLKWCRDDKHLMNLKDNVNNLLVINYAMAGRNRRYREIPMIEVMKWSNLRATVFTEIEKIASMTQRQQFIEFQVPTELPIKMELDRSSEELKRMHAKIFGTTAKLDLLDFWRWLNPATRKLSHMGKISDNHLPYINFVFRVGSNFALLNLAKLNEWIYGHGIEEIETSEDDDIDTEDTAYVQIQKRVLKFLKILNEMRKDENTQVIISDANKQIDYHVENEIDVEIDDDESDEETQRIQQATMDDQPPVVEVNPTTQEISTVEPPIAPVGDTIVEKDVTTGKLTVRYLHPQERKEIALRKNKLLQQVENSHAENIDLFKKMKDDDITVQKVLKDDIKKLILNEDEDAPEKPVETTSELEVKYTSTIRDQATALVKTSFMTQGEMKRIEAMANSFKKIKDPYGSGRTLEEVVKEDIPIADEVPEVQLPDMPLVVDKQMLKSRNVDFDKRYIKNVMPRDVVRSVLAVQKAGVAVTSYEKEDLIDAGNEFERHSIQVTPVGGATSTIHVKIPKIREDGVFLVANTKYLMKKARRDRPTRKVNDNKVSLTSYYGKLFLNRSDKGKFNFDKWMLNQIELKVIDGLIDKTSYGVCSHPDIDLPRELIVLCTRYRQLRLKERGMTLELDKIYVDADGYYVIGKDQNGDEIYFDRKTNMVLYGKDQAIDLSTLLGLDDVKRPVEYAEMNVLGESIPVGFALARQYGISELCKRLDVKPVKLERNQRIELTHEQWALKFADEVWVFPRENKIASLLLGGLKKYESQLKELPAASFEDKDVYGAILTNEGLNIRYEYELDLMGQMFVDDITAHLLEKMHEPTDFHELLIRGSELLLTGYIPTEINMDDMLIKGYERIPGAIYGELVKAARAHKLKPITSKRRFEVGPNDIWMAIQKDPSIEIRDEINPLKNMKEKDNVTFGGVGGRSRRSMTRPTRSFHPTDLGTISEATPDNQDVGITTFLSANPQFTDLYGMTERVDEKNIDATSILSSVAMTAPFVDKDDANRIGFVGTQSEHRIPIKGAMPMPVRTGYENVVAHKTDKGFSFVAPQDGKVIEKKDDVVTFEYKDGRKEAVEYGLKMASSKGHFYKHNLVCDYEVGNTFRKGDVLIFNQQFFLRDILNPGQVVQVNYVLAPTALVDFEETLEDGCCVSERIGDQLSTEAVHMKTVVMDATATLSEMVKVGDQVDIDDILCVIEDQHVEATHIYDDEASEVLRRLGSHTPKAGAIGKIEKIEAYYFADPEELSPSIRAAIAPLDAKRTRVASKTRDGRAPTGRLMETTRLNGELIGPGKVLFRFFISDADIMSTGDKAVFALQLKTTVSRRLIGKNETESGRPIDAWFGYQSISNRIVKSPELLGTTSSLLRLATKRALEAYDK